MTDRGESFQPNIEGNHNLAQNVATLKLNNSLNDLRNSIVGSYLPFTTSYGEKPIVYTDWTASGRLVDKIEYFLNDQVMPFYGNTHTTASITGDQSTSYRHEARDIIADDVNAKVSGKDAVDVVFFTGNGTTAAVHKIVDALGLNTPLPKKKKNATKPIVFTSSYEHHSNILPWRESVADVVTIGYDVNTGVDLADLEQQLIKHAHRVLKIGSFSAASNLTGVCTAVDEVSILLHQHNALAFFDYATAAPYVKIDMNPVLINNPHSALAYKDAVFFSGHKFLGGPGCPGVLIAKRRIMPQFNETPSSASVGGGTVFYVTENHHMYIPHLEEREEGGTPQVLADVKMGLVMALKKSLCPSFIEQEEFRISQYVQSKLQAHPAVVLLGKVPQSESAHGYTGHYLPIFSFLLRCSDKFLHFQFVTMLLNDLFGIQSRGGCMCAGPFAETLLGITSASNQAFEQALLNHHEILRPGFTRLSLPYWMSQAEVDFVVDAILFVAEHGHKFISAYDVSYKTGKLHHVSKGSDVEERKSLYNFPSTRVSPQLATAVGALDHWKVTTTEEVLARVRADAEVELAKCEQVMKELRERGGEETVSTDSTTNAESLQSSEHLRWFVTTEEVHALHRSGDGAIALKELTGTFYYTSSMLVVMVMFAYLFVAVVLHSAGPIRPAVLSNTSTHCSNTKDTAIQQSLPLPSFARTGKEVSPPRYMTLSALLRSRGLTAATDTTDSSHELTQLDDRCIDVDFNSSTGRRGWCSCLVSLHNVFGKILD